MKKLVVICFLIVAATTTAQLPSYVPTNGLVGYWPFDNTANDLGPYHNHGTVTGATPTNDRFNTPSHAYSFNGLSDYIRVPDNTSLSGFSELTMALWIKVDTLDGDHAMIAKWYQQLNCGSKSDNYICHLQYGFIQFVTDFNNTVGLPVKPPLTQVYLNTWKHLAFVFRNANALEVYSDGVLIYTTPTNGTGICATTNDLFFGADVAMASTPNSRFFSGSMDDIGIWSRALSPCEIKKLYLGTSLNAIITNTLICRGGSVSLSPSGASSYSLNGAALTSSAVLSPTANTAYTLIGNYGMSGCQDTLAFSVTVSECTGLPASGLTNQLEVFPNPTNGKATFRANGFSTTGCSLVLENLEGKALLSKSMESENMELDLGNLPEGVYLVKVRNASGTLLCLEKLVLTK